MRVSMITLLLLCHILYTSAQIEPRSLKPSELVNETRQRGENFESVQLFSSVAAQVSPNSEALRQLNAYNLLNLEPQGMRSFARRPPAAMTFRIPSVARSGDIELELVQVDILTDDFSVQESSADSPTEVQPGVHYRGTVKGDPSSIAAISIYEDEVMGLISSNSLGNLVLGKMQAPGMEYQHIIYNDEELMRQEAFLCDTPDDGPDYAPEDLLPNAYRNSNKCVRVYFEVDYDIFQDKGGTAGATNYITGLFNQVATLYANDNVTLQVSQLFIWTNPSPYSGTNSSQLLNQFQATRTSFNGDIGQLLSYKASGGIAVLNGLCHPFNSAKLSFSSINTTYRTLPSYSFSVMVVAHELGHLLGSHHTHACVWNGNNTALDGCAGFTEGSCANPGLPAGGTIMSYCHISSVGINFNLGFGQQPGNVIRNRIAAANCVQTCATGGNGGGGSGGGGDSGGGDSGGGSGGGSGGSGGGSGGSGGGSNPSACNQNTVYLRLVLDSYGPETTWKLRSSNGQVVKSGGPYPKGTAGTQVRDTFCLANGCYSFEIADEYGDGICCAFGNGSYQLTTSSGQTIVRGGQFGFSEITDFCFPVGGDDGGGGGNATCVRVDFKTNPIISHGGGQDMGTHQLLNGGTVLMIQNNAWKAIMLNYTVTRNTVIDFEFGSTRRGEIHGLGFDNDANISANYTFKLYGTQAWGIQNYNTYPGDNTWRRYVIPVGQFYTGQFDRLFFTADHDDPPRNGNSFFRNIQIYEGSRCQALPEGIPDDGLNLSVEQGGNFAPTLEVFPNPAHDRLSLRFRCKEEGNATIQVFNTLGQRVKQLPIGVYQGLNDEQIDVADLPPGTYLIRIDTRVNQLVSKFNVSR